MFFLKICYRLFDLHINGKANVSGDFSHAEVVKKTKSRVGLRHDFFKRF